MSDPTIGLNAQFAQTQLQQVNDPVGVAHNRIKDALDTSGWFDVDVTGDEVDRSLSAYNSLSPDQKNELISRMSNDTLDQWLIEINGMTGGLSTDEKTTFFNDLATNLDAEQLVRVVDNMRYLGDGERLGTAIGRFATGSTVTEFARLLGPSLTGETQSVGNFSTTEDVLARTIGALTNRSDIRAALHALTPDQRMALATETYVHGGHRPDAFNSLIDAVSRSGDLGLRTEFFTHIAAQGAQLRSGTLGMSNDAPALDHYYEGLQKLIGPNPRAMVDLMADQGIGMRELTDFLELGIAREDFQYIGQLGLQIRRGEQIPGSDQSDFARFEHDFDPSGNNEDFRNATLSGYFTGAAMAAAENINLNEAGRRKLAVSIVSGGAITAASLAPSPASLIVGVGTKILPHVVESLAAEASGNRSSFFTAIHEAGIPRDGEGVLPRGEARTQFNAAIGEVLDAHGFNN